jgi:hypothetical protein
VAAFAGRFAASEGWSRRWDSNPQPPVYKTGALPLSYAGELTLRLHQIDWEKTENPTQNCDWPCHPRLHGSEGWWLPGDSNPEPTD